MYVYVCTKPATCLVTVTPALIAKLARATSRTDNQEYQEVNWKFPHQFLASIFALISFVSFRYELCIIFFIFFPLHIFLCTQTVKIIALLVAKRPHCSNTTHTHTHTETQVECEAIGGHKQDDVRHIMEFFLCVTLL